MSNAGSDLYSQPLRIKLDVKVPMRDGVRLSTDIYLPNSDGPFPALLLRTIYDNQMDPRLTWVPRFVERGYVAVLQDCRGRFDSDGEWEPYLHEAADGYDTQEWIGAQPWCDGNIGTFGSSYVGFTQTLTAPLRSSYLKALVPSASQQDNYGHWYVDGALQLHTAMNFINMAGRTMQRGSRGLISSEELYRRLPLASALDDIVDLPFYRDAVLHHTYDEHWSSYSLRDRYDEVEAPALFLTGWYDNLVHETFTLFRGWTTKARSEEARRQTKLLVGPWTHGDVFSTVAGGDISFGKAEVLDMAAEHLRWYDRRLKRDDNGIDDEPPIRIFVMGDNVWRFEDEWPPARAQYVSYYLDSAGDANSLHGKGVLSTEPPGDGAPDRFHYDPMDPVPTLGGQSMAIPMIEAGALDRQPVERRDDVLVYTTAPLTHDLEVTGPVSLVLHASSSAPDTDFTAALVDVHPDGKAIVICEGIVRARFRESIELPELIEPGRVYAFNVDMWETSNVFKAGHRVRLEVSSSNFPRFDRNLNTGHRPGVDAEMRVAEQTVYHDSERPSRLVLPVIPR